MKKVKIDVSKAVQKVEHGLHKAQPQMKAIGRAVNCAAGLTLIGFGSLVVLISVTFLAPPDSKSVWHSLIEKPGLALIGAIFIVAGSLLFWFNRPRK